MSLLTFWVSFCTILSLFLWNIFSVCSVTLFFLHRIKLEEDLNTGIQFGIQMGWLFRCCLNDGCWNNLYLFYRSFLFRDSKYQDNVKNSRGHSSAKAWSEQSFFVFLSFFIFFIFSFMSLATLAWRRRRSRKKKDF